MLPASHAIPRLLSVAACSFREGLFPAPPSFHYRAIAYDCVGGYRSLLGGALARRLLALLLRVQGKSCNA